MNNPLTNYNIGGGGNNLVKNPLHLADDECFLTQNAERVPDQNTGGEGALRKRGGLQPLNGSALAGSVSGFIGLGLLTTYVRTLLFPKGQEDATSFVSTTDGSSLSNSSTPLDWADSDKFTDANGTRDARRGCAYRNYIYYPGNDYTKGTTNPEITVWDGTSGQLVARIPVGPSATALTAAYAITDMIVANGKIYFGVHDPGGSAPSLAGRVMSLDPETGIIAQVANAFGNGASDVSGGYPSALCWHLGQLFVGLNGSSTTDGIGKVVRCRPDTDATWTSDVSNLVSHVSSLCEFKGHLYAGCQSSVSTNAKIYKRTASSGAWAAVVTSGAGAAGGDGHYSSLYVHSDELYAVEYYSGATDILHIIKSSDGASWSTSRDVDANDSPADPPQFASGIVTFGSALFVVFRAVSASSNDGFIMKLASGSWSKLATDNYAGPVVIQVSRS